MWVPIWRCLIMVWPDGVEGVVGSGMGHLEMMAAKPCLVA
jgi:hypothetical protein